MNRIALGLSLAASSIAFGQVLAYEPFQYPAGNLSVVKMVALDLANLGNRP